MEIGELETRNKLLSAPEWVDNIPNLPGVSLLVVPITAPSVTRHQSKLMRAISVSDVEVDGGLFDDVEKRVDVALMRDKVLKDWKGLTENKTPVPFTPENLDRLLDNDFFLGGVRFATAYLASQLNRKYEELVKNSSASLSGPNSTAETTEKQ